MVVLTYGKRARMSARSGLGRCGQIRSGACPRRTDLRIYPGVSLPLYIWVRQYPSTANWIPSLR